MIEIIPEQIEFSSGLPVVIGNTDYKEFERRLIRIGFARRREKRNCKEDEKYR